MRGEDATPLDGVPEAVVRTTGLTKRFRLTGGRGRLLHAVDDVNISIGRGEIVAVVGESGSGKSTVARLIARVYTPTRGEVLFRGRTIADLGGHKAIREYRGQVPMVFQDPYGSLNPVHTIGYVLERGLKLHRRELDGAGRRAEMHRVLDAVGLSPARTMITRFPRELSGGQRQRVGFAQALSYRPAVILADEPVSMLDVSLRIGVLNLMRRLRDEQGLSLLYITHDIASARYVADRIVVMYAGQIVEAGTTTEVLHRPAHPYTKLLLSAVPNPRAEVDVAAVDLGEPPRVVDPTPGCRFRHRCPIAEAVCETTPPEIVVAPSAAADDAQQAHVAERHTALCHFAG